MQTGTVIDRPSTAELLWALAAIAVLAFSAVWLIELGSKPALASGALLAWCAASAFTGLSAGWFLQLRRRERPFQQRR